MSIVGLVLDVAIVGLLAATIAFAVRLNRQLSTLRDSKAELEALIRGFAEATERADAGVQNMKAMTEESGEKLQKALQRAQTIRDELQFMVETADSLASRLEGAISTHRSATPARPASPLTASRPGEPPRPQARAAEPPPAAVMPPAPPAPPAATGEARSRAERELMQALENLR
ncbi:DUF6468 domain-containing protein [Arenibaculum pallidiluteum]|uniref:DUF6468 domain-containing protein n=1 Tax=Arenibaculum pallidiluteum TaxID=2812559 RepID=UPI001A969129|nr:DUF6468 domain-containing protein [Arenibaculum pallidiluteum]